jgi:hypothetical protein
MFFRVYESGSPLFEWVIYIISYIDEEGQKNDKRKACFEWVIYIISYMGVARIKFEPFVRKITFKLEVSLLPF